jgi:16S rRNA (guanine(1405)-N(7))-methyltransferase
MSECDPIEQIVAGVLRGKKYRAVCQDTVRRIAVEQWARHGGLGRGGKRAIKAAIKATRARLHQVYAAYESPVDYARAARDLESAYAGGDRASIEAACRRLLALHTSTRERLPILERFYGELWAHTGVPGVVLDLACGLNPLSVPWMGLDEGAAYRGYDIDAARVTFLRRALPLAGLDAYMHLQDVLCEAPSEAGEVALLMKSSACLERQQAGATLSLLDALRVRYVVVTFPVRSLGNREKGMAAHYERTFRTQIANRPWPVIRLLFESELVFIVDKGSNCYTEEHRGDTEEHRGGRKEKEDGTHALCGGDADWEPAGH